MTAQTSRRTFEARDPERRKRVTSWHPPRTRHCSVRCRRSEAVPERYWSRSPRWSTPSSCPWARWSSANHRELLVTLGPTRVVVIERRALDAVIERAPDLLDDYRVDQCREQRARSGPRCRLVVADRERCGPHVGRARGEQRFDLRGDRGLVADDRGVCGSGHPSTFQDALVVGQACRTSRTARPPLLAPRPHRRAPRPGDRRRSVDRVDPRPPRLCGGAARRAPRSQRRCPSRGSCPRCTALPPGGGAVRARRRAPGSPHRRRAWAHPRSPGTRHRRTAPRRHGATSRRSGRTRRYAVPAWRTTIRTCPR